MMKPWSKVIAALVGVVMVSTSAAAQAKSGGFSLGYTDIGPTVGLGNLGNANLSIGGRFEHAIKALPDLGNGMLGIEASFDYYSYSNSVYSLKVIPLGVTANYHFRLDNPKIDPFLGLGLGYQVYNCSYANIGGLGCGNSALYFIGRVGARYFFAPSMAVYGDLGAGAATINLGITFKLQ
ncbi:MAG: outer membrane beta-barrel protein [Gemmatimonadaceae bacterium]